MITVDEKNSSKVAVVEGVTLESTNDALDLLADANHLYDCQKLLIPKDCVSEEFFDLKTGLAGEILQKFTNYGVRVAFVGDFSGYQSKSLRDFIRESNQRKQVMFLEDKEAALSALHG